MNLPAPESVDLPLRAAAYSGACRWLVSLDFDGTLFDERFRCVPAAFFRCMEKLRPHGVRWGINTGRSMGYLMQDYLPSAPYLPDFICTCERYVYMADAAGILQADESYNEECRLHNAALRQHFAPVLHTAAAELQQLNPGWQWVYAADDPLSIEAADSATMDLMTPHLLRLIEHTPEIEMQRAGRYLRFADARYDKGTVLQRVAALYGVTEEYLFIIGDGHNDLLAFRHCPRAFCAAPANAHPEVEAELRQLGGYLSPERGVLEALDCWCRVRSVIS